MTTFDIGGVIPQLFGRKPTIAKHMAASLLKEREQFLVHLLRRGVSVKFVRLTSLYLLHIVEILKLPQLRTIRREELAAAFRRDLARRRRLNPALSLIRSSQTLEHLAMRWLTFHGKLRRQRRHQAFRAELDGFIEHSRSRLLSPVTLDHLRSHVGNFLRWYSQRKRPLSKLGLRDVDRFVLARRANGWSAISLNTMVRAVRTFFRYGEERGWCKPGITQGIITPNRARVQIPPQGREWDEVKQLLKSITESDLAGIRAKAIIYLIATYGLRSREIERLTVLDFDWNKKILTIRRSKRGPAQRYPLLHDIARYVLRYIKVRPMCSCEQLFVTLNPPYRPVSRKGLGMLLRHRFKKIGITTGRLGPHSIRHARATQLLHKGMSLNQVSDFLGHRCLDATLIYAKFNLKLLKPVADFDLGDLL
jgi:integrase/recombinase XerD